MKFDLTAAKAWMGALLASAAPSVSDVIIKTFEASTSFDIPASIEGLILTGIAAVLGYAGVYFTPNKQTI